MIEGRVYAVPGALPEIGAVIEVLQIGVGFSPSKKRAPMLNVTGLPVFRLSGLHRRAKPHQVFT